MKNPKKGATRRIAYGGVVLLFIVGMAALAASTFRWEESQEARVTLSQSKYPTSDEALKSLTESIATAKSGGDRDFESACVGGAIKCGKITIIKNAIEDSYLDFTFYTNIPNYSSFVVDDDATLTNPSNLSNIKTLFTSPNGNYLVAELPSSSVTDTFVSCYDPTNNSVILNGNVAAVVINMNNAESITCTFRNIMAQQTGACVLSDTWTQMVDFGGGERSYAAGFSIGAKGYIGTGYSVNGATQDFWEYDSSTDVWTQKADFGGGVRASATAFSIGTKGYMGIGEDGTSPVWSAIKNDFWEYDPATDLWTQKADFGGGNRYSASGFSIGVKGYIGTGYNLTWPPLVYETHDDFWEYDPVSDLWTQKADFGGGIRGQTISFSIGSKGYIGTGFSGMPGGSLFQDFWEYNPATDLWTQKADFGGGVRFDALGLNIGNKGYVGGGASDDPYSMNDFWEYNPATDLWTQKADFGGGSIRNTVGFGIDTKGYIGTGVQNTEFSWNIEDNFWCYQP